MSVEDRQNCIQQAEGDSALARAYRAPSPDSPCEKEIFTLEFMAGSSRFSKDRIKYEYYHATCGKQI